MLKQHEIEVRVRYEESDPMGFLYYGNYFTYFEMGRTELLRASGGNYREMEAGGLRAVIVEAQCRYHQPARYDDLLMVQTTVTRVRRHPHPICCRRGRAFSWPCDLPAHELPAKIAC